VWRKISSGDQSLPENGVVFERKGTVIPTILVFVTFNLS